MVVIAKREFFERVRSKWFVVMTILWPVLMIGMMVVPAIIGGQGSKGAKVQIVDKTGQLGKDMSAALALWLEWNATEVPATTSEPELRHRIETNEINGFLVIPEDALDGGTIVYKGDNASNQTVGILVSKAVTGVVINKRATRAGVTALQLIAINKPIDVVAKHTTGEEEGTSGILAFLVGYMLAFLIYIAITLYGINVMRSIVTEKSSRVVELMVAACKPRDMMAGKILGVGAAGLAQIAIWFVLGAIGLAYKDDLLGALGFAPSPKSALLPTLTAMQLGITMLCFVFGYLFYSSMYAAVGAMVASEQDSQQAQMPVTFLLVIAMIAIPAVTNDPRGQAASIMTMVPFWSPMLMPLRYFLGGATIGQVGLSLGILAISTYVMARAAAKIYRVGILMYGKRPSLRELVRWLRY